MPLYEYRCDNGHIFEVIQSMSDEPVTECETCGAPARRVLHAPAIHFKGSGFHNTDYGTRSSNKAKQAAAAAEKESGSDSKPSGDSSSGSSGETKSGSGSSDSSGGPSSNGSSGSSGSD